MNPCEHEWDERRERIKEGERWYIIFFRRCKKCGKREGFHYIDEDSMIPDG